MVETAMVDTETNVSTNFENIKIEKDGPVAILTIDRPKVLNALNDATIAELSIGFDLLAGTSTCA